MLLIADANAQRFLGFLDCVGREFFVAYQDRTQYFVSRIQSSREAACVRFHRLARLSARVLAHKADGAAAVNQSISALTAKAHLDFSSSLGSLRALSETQPDLPSSHATV